MQQTDPTRIPPPAKFEIAPFEGGKVVYQKLAPSVAGAPSGGMLYFILKVKNQTEGTIIAREMEVAFPGTTIPPIDLPSRDVVIPAGARRTIELAGSVSDSVAKWHQSFEPANYACV